VGLLRSGTNMLVRGLDAAPEVEARNENDRRLFHRFRLRGDDVLLDVVRRSRHAIVLVKPLCDSHRVDELLALPTPVPGRALWMWRDVDDRARSEVAKFGDANLRALRAIADGTIGERWQGGRLPARTRRLLASFDYDRMDPHTAAALFWWARNDLYFRLGLDRREDVLLVAYGDVVADPQAAARRVCAFLELPYRPEFVADVTGTPSPGSARRPEAPEAAQHRGRLPIDAAVRALCDELTARLREAPAVARG
jgi:hypothetical protein